MSYHLIAILFWFAVGAVLLGPLRDRTLRAERKRKSMTGEED